MEISKSLFAATVVSATLLTGAVAYAASSGVIDGRDDNVGNLQPTTAQNPAVTVVVDPTSTRSSTSTTRSSTSATVTTAPTTTRRPDVTAATAPTSTIDDHGGDRDDNSGSGSSNSGSDDDNSGSGSGDDRRHGRGSDDD